MTSTTKSGKKLLSLYHLFMAAGLPGWLLFFRNILYFFIRRRRSLEDYATVDDSAIIQILFIAVVFFISCYILFKNPQKKKFLTGTPQVFLLGYIAVCFLSIIWTPDVFVTAYRSLESLAYLLLIALVAYNLVTRVGYQDIIEWAILWIVWDIFWTVATNVKLQGWDFLIWPFIAGNLSVPMFFFFALLLTQRVYFKYVILAFAFLMVRNTTFFGIAAGLLGFYFGDSRYKGWLFIITVIIVTALFFVDVEELLLHTLFYGRSEVSMAATSGRDKVWNIAWEAFLQKPFLGYGFVDGENRVLYRNFSGAISTHSFFFSGLLGTGLTGTLFLILYFLSAFFKARSSFFPSSIRPAMVSTFIMSLVISLASPGVGGRVYGAWIPVVLVLTLVSALEYKFQILNQVKNIQNRISHENNMGHTQLSGLPHSGV